MRFISTRKEKDRSQSSGIDGLPAINYRLPIVVTTLAAVLICVLAAFLSLTTLGTVANYVTRSSPEGSNDAVFIGCICAPLGITFLGAALYFLRAIFLGVRDLSQPVHYTRGTVAQREHVGSRRGGEWLYVNGRYAGPDLAVASEVTDEQRAASPDRSQIVQPRFAPAPRPAKQVPMERPGSYLPAHRLTADLQSLDPLDTTSGKPPLLFRIDAAAQAAIRPDDEVLIAHSPYLQHVYYVSHLRGGEWESFPNKALI